MPISTTKIKIGSNPVKCEISFYLYITEMKKRFQMIYQFLFSNFQSENFIYKSNQYTKLFD